MEMKLKTRIIAIRAFIVVTAGVFLAGCGGNGGGGTTTRDAVPSILNINSSTDPSSPVSLPIEINGSGFLSAPGKVVFTQAATGITVSVVPNASGWSDTGIVVTVPSGSSSSTPFSAGDLSVTVVTSGGTSNGVTLLLIPTPVNFTVNDVTWTTTKALPTALTGLRAVGVPVTSSSAFIVVAGGFDGTTNRVEVLSNTLNPDGTVGPTWTAISDMPLPASRAHHAMVEADSGNSLVPTGSHFIYVIGGQEFSTDSPGGTSTVYMASVDATTGAVGPWTSLSSSLPEPLVGCDAALFNGFVYVVGGLRPDGTASPSVYSAQVKSDGTLSAWTKSSNSYPLGISFPAAFGFGGKLYVIGGDTASSTDPNTQTNTGTNAVYYASASKGSVGTWALNPAPIIKSRVKQIAWIAFGQVIDAEGIYNGSPGSTELERSQVNPDGTLATWTGITSTNLQVSANVYNATALVSPLLSAAGTPRFLLVGGQAFSSSSGPGGKVSNTVYVNTAP